MAATTKTYNLTKGPILNKLLVVAVPIMGTQLMQMAYNLTDMFWLGRVGSDAVAASGSAGMYLWLSMAFMMIGRLGAEIGVSHSFGQDNKKAALEYSQNSVLLALALGVVYGAAMVIFKHPLIGFFNIQEQHVAKDAAEYLAIAGLAVPATYITGALTGTFNGSGNSRTPFYINSIGLIINMILDPLLIIQFNMGIIGAAIATAVGQYVVAILFIAAVKFGRTRPFKTYCLLVIPKSGRLSQIVRWSWPAGLESMLFTFLSMIISRILATYSADALAVQRVGSQIESLAWLIGGGFASAVTAFVGQNYGAGKWTRIHRGIKISVRTMFVWGICVTCIMFFGGRILVSLFLKEAELIEIGVIFMRYLAVCQIAGCLEYNCAGAFRGIGKTLPPSIASIGGNMIRVPLVYVLSKTALGLDGIWLGIAAGAILRGLWTCVWFYFTVRRLPREDAAVPMAP